jgi:hypothetical protein
VTTVYHGRTSTILMNPFWRPVWTQRPRTAPWSSLGIRAPPGRKRGAVLDAPQRERRHGRGLLSASYSRLRRGSTSSATLPSSNVGHRGREPAARVGAGGVPSREELEEEHAEAVHVALLGGHAGAEEVRVVVPRPWRSC